VSSDFIVEFFSVSSSYSSAFGFDISFSGSSFYKSSSSASFGCSLGASFIGSYFGSSTTGAFFGSSTTGASFGFTDGTFCGGGLEAPLLNDGFSDFITFYELSCSPKEVILGRIYSTGSGLFQSRPILPQKHLLFIPMKPNRSSVMVSAL